MATNRWIRGISGRGFRVTSSATSLPVTCKEGVLTQVDLEDVRTQDILSRERDNFVRVAAGATSATLRGLTRTGFRVQPFGGAATISNATPAVVGLTAHGLLAGDAVQFTTTGGLPASLVVGQKYFVQSTGLSANAFRISLTSGGADINTSTAGSGTHTLVPLPKMLQVDSPSVKVNLNDGPTKRLLKRNFGRWIVSGDDTVDIWGLTDQQASFRLIDPTLTLVFAGANNDLTFVPKVADSQDFSIKFTAVDATNAVADIDSTGDAITIALEVVASVAASGTLTSDGTSPVDGDTVTVNNRTYRFKDTMALVGDVKREGTSDASLDHLVKAINGTGTAGVDYFAGTLAVTGMTSANRTGTGATGAIVVTATTKGIAGNLFAKSEAGIHLDWDGVGAVMTGGVDYLITSTAAEIKALIEADTPAGANEMVTVTHEGDGSGAVAAVALTTLGADPEPLARGETVNNVDLTNSFNVGQLRRRFKAWVEEDATP